MQHRAAHAEIPQEEVKITKWIKVG
jgi:hypothetical protein